MAYTSSSAERLVTNEFLRTFGLPVVNPESGSNLDSEIGSQMSGGDFAIHYARRLADRFAFGLLGGYSLQEEQQTSPNVYRTDHNSHVWSAKGSLAGRLFEEAGPFQNWSLGANGLLASTRIDGLSADDVHTDDYAWDRNNVGFNVHLLGQMLRWIKGGLDFRYGSFEGLESAQYNWSPQFSLNPTNETILLERSVFDEGFRSKSFLTRWEGQPPGIPASFGLGFRAGQNEYWVLPGTNVNSFVTARNQRITDWELSGGGSYFLPKGRGLLAGEMAWGFLDRDESITPPTQRVGASMWALGVGGEYAVTLPIVARAGYRLTLEDQNRDKANPEGEFTAHRLALGAGYRTPSAKVLIDFAFNYEWKSSGAEKAGAADEVVEDQDRKSVTLQLRTLF
jgi:opacity protein-like surface antigen